MRHAFLLVLAAAAALAAGEADAEPAKTVHEDIEFGQLPEAVQTAAKKVIGTAKVTEVEKDTKADGTVIYEIEYEDADGKEHELCFDAAGKPVAEPEEHDDEAIAPKE